MLYAVISQAQADRILLYPSEQAARDSAGGERPIDSVAVPFEARHRRLTLLSSRPGPVDPTWAAPAEQHADGSITTRGPIPMVLFTGCTRGCTRAPSDHDVSAR